MQLLFVFIIQIVENLIYYVPKSQRVANSSCSNSQCSLSLDAFVAYDDTAFELQDEIRLDKMSFRNMGISPSCRCSRSSLALVQ